ncbi:hypothetical protein [Anditalea andensis]|nr:hypothetical protein [Anditalea andensis]
MSSKNSFEEVEKLLQEVGAKIEELIAKAAEATGEAQIEIEKKIKDLNLNKESLEKEFQKRKQSFEKSYNENFKNAEPDFLKSRDHVVLAFHHLVQAVKSVFSK